jgi:adenylosuccinate lyase
MRRYKVANAYEKFKVLTRGKKISPNELKQFVSQLEIPAAARKALLALKPATYVGNARKQAVN